MIAGTFWVRGSFIASSCIPTSSAKVHEPWLDAIQHNFQDPNRLIPTYALLSRIRLSSLGDVLASAEQVQHIIGTYSEPNLAPEGIQSRATNRQDPLREFSNVCRAELEAMQNQLQ
jgi:hypothetical protein